MLVAARKPTGERLDTLEERVSKLERLTDRVRRDQRETVRQVKELRELVEGVPGKVKMLIDEQTSDVKVAIAESETRNADRITDVARQWPAGAIVAATAALAIVGDLLLAAFHLPHLS